MKRNISATIDCIAYALAARDGGVNSFDVTERASEVNRTIRYRDVSVRLHRLRRAGKLVGRYDRIQTGGIQVRNFLTEDQANACQSVVKTLPETTSERDAGRRRKKAPGVRTLEDLRLRCVIDEETGCWLWRGARSKETTRVWLAAEMKSRTASSAAWKLAGKPLPAGHEVYRLKCARWDCIWPDHGGAGTRKEMFAFIAQTDRMKGDPKRSVINQKNSMRMAVSREKVLVAEEMLARGVFQKTVAATLGIHKDTVNKIASGRHVNCSQRAGLVVGASIFTFTGRVQIQEPEPAKKPSPNRRTYAGGNNPNAKLSEEQQEAICVRYAAVQAASRIPPSRDAMKWEAATGRDTVEKIAKDHGIAREHVYRVAAKARAAA